MPALQLATAGDELRVWRLDSGGDNLLSPTAPIVSSRPHKGGVTAVSFNHNSRPSQNTSSVVTSSFCGAAVLISVSSLCCLLSDSVLVSSGVDGLLSLQYANGALLFTLPASASPSLPALSCLSLTSGSRYVVCGGQSPRLTVWDLKRQTINRQLEGHKEEITCCDLLSSASASSSALLVASGSTSSAVLVHSLESGQTRCSLSLPSLHPVRALHFSPHRAALLAVGGDDGQPCLFDINTSDLLPSLSSSSHSHLASITALLFSPSHPSLLLSCSLASTLHYHDTASSQLIQSVHCAAAVTSADWCDDGHHIAVGCSDGSLLLYDVRKEGAEVASFRAHDREVRSIKFQKLSKASAGGTAAVAAGSGKAKVTPGSVVDARSSVFIPSTPQLAAADLREPIASGSAVTPATAKAVSRAGRAARVADGAAGEAEADVQYVPVTPYVPHSKPFNAASSSSSLLREAAAPAAIAFSGAAFSSHTAATASSSFSSPSVTAASSPLLQPRGSLVSHVPVLSGSSSSAAASASLQPSYTASPPSSRRQLAAAFADRHTPSSSSSASLAAARPVVSGRRSSFPAPAPFSSSILPASSSASSSRRNTLDKLLHAHSLPVAPADSEDEGELRLVAAVDAAVERRLRSLYEEMRNDLQLLQVDMFRQFESQSQQLTASVDSLQQQNQLLRDELQQLRAEWRLHEQ